MTTPRVRLGDLLVEAQIITREQLEEVLALQSKDGRRLGTLLVESGLVTETQVTQILSQQLSVPWVSLYHIDFSRQLLNLVPRDIAEEHCLVPIFVRRVRGLGETLYVAMDDPTDESALTALTQYSGLPVRAMIAPPSDISSAIRVYYGGRERSASLSEAQAEAAQDGAVAQAAAEEQEAAAGGEAAPEEAGEPKEMAEAAKAPEAQAEASEAAEASETKAEAAEASETKAEAAEVSETKPEAAEASGTKAEAAEASGTKAEAAEAAETEAVAAEASPEAAASEPSPEAAPSEPPPEPAASEPGTEAARAEPGPEAAASEPPPDSGEHPLTPPPESGPQIEAREISMPAPKQKGGARMITLTLLDGTQVNLPARGSKQHAPSERPEPSDDQLTARDLVAALRAVSHGADATEILGDNARWEALFAALLSLLLKKHLIADWEFIDEYRNV